MLTILPLALFAGGVFLGFQELNRVAAVFVIGAGIAAIVSRDAMAAAQNRLVATRWRYLLGGSSNQAQAQVFLFWGLGCIAVGAAWLVAG